MRFEPDVVTDFTVQKVIIMTTKSLSDNYRLLI